MISKLQMAAAAALWVLCASGVARGQIPGHDCGFIRLVDAVCAGTGKMDCLIDGQSVRPDGYQPGNVTGGIALNPTPHKILLRRNGVMDGQAQLSVVAHETMILIAYAEQVPATGLVAAHWELRILRLKHHPADGPRSATFVSVARQPSLTVEIRQSNGTWESVLVKRLGFATTAIRQARGYLPVRCLDQPLAAVSVAATGHFVTVLYEEDQGTLRSLNFQDYHYLSPE